jgi:hypothetical protein
MKRLLLAAALATALISSCTAKDDKDGTCTGSTPCTACRNCSSCKHCHQNGGKCGVCR